MKDEREPSTEYCNLYCDVSVAAADSPIFLKCLCKEEKQNNQVKVKVKVSERKTSVGKEMDVTGSPEAWAVANIVRFFMQ